MQQNPTPQKAVQAHTSPLEPREQDVASGYGAPALVHRQDLVSKQSH